MGCMRLPARLSQSTPQLTNQRFTCSIRQSTPSIIISSYHQVTILSFFWLASHRFIKMSRRKPIKCLTIQVKSYSQLYKHNPTKLNQEHLRPPSEQQPSRSQAEASPMYKAGCGMLGGQCCSQNGLGCIDAGASRK